MVKKALDKYKSIQTLNEDIINEIIDLSNLANLIEVLSGNDNERTELITSFIAHYNINANDEGMKTSLLNKQFIQLLSLCVMSDSVQLRYNAIASIINLITSYNDDDNDIIDLFISNTMLLNNITAMIKLLPSINTISNNSINTNGDLIDKVILILFELLALMIDLIEDEGSNEAEGSKLQLNTIAVHLIELVMNKSTHNNNGNEVYMNSFGLLFKIISITPLISSSCLNINQFIAYLIKSIKENNTIEINCFNDKELVKAFQLCSLFYLLSINKHLINDIELNVLLPHVINQIYIGVNYDLKHYLEQFSKELSLYTTNSNNTNEDNQNDKEEVITNQNKDLMNMITNLEIIVHSIYCYIKTFNDIIENTDLTQQSLNINNSSKINVNNNEDIEMSDELIEDSDINNKHSPDTQQSKYAQSISEAITKYYLANPNTPIDYSIKNILNDKFINSILNLQCNYSFHAFYLNKFNKMLSIKEHLYNIEYISYTLINNITLQFKPLLSLSSNTQNKIIAAIAKMVSADNISSDESLISIIILCLRTIISSYQQSIIVCSNIYISLDYKILFRLMNKHINDIFIKCNIIDIIALLYSNDEFNSFHLEINLEICQLLNSMFYNEDNIEVLSHVINALMDIYQGDNAKINKNLKRIGCIQLMKGGTNEFRTRMMTAKKSGEMSEDVYEYVKETFGNMKRFIKYKEDSFIQLKF